MRRAPVASAAFAATVVAGCWGMTIDVGTTRRDPDDAGASGPIDATEGRDATREDAASPLGACLASGRVDRYYTAKDLTARLVGGWAQCPGVVASPLPCAPRTKLWGIRFSIDGTFALLGADGETHDYLEQPDNCGRGVFRIYASSTADGGLVDGGASTPAEYVPSNDTTPRNGLEVHLFADGGGVDVEFVEFETGPERMFLREQGALDTRGYFARVVARPR